MNVGVVFPHAEIGTEPAAIRDFAQAAEQLGYSYIHVYDHVLGASPERAGAWDHAYTHQTPFHEPFVLAGFIAASTKRIRVVLGVLVLPQRQAALVAKQAAEAHVLSGGRLVLGVGTGWNRVEYQALGQDFDSRGRRLEEQVELIRRLWNEDVVDFEGEFHTVEAAGINPRPAHDIPIWFGGSIDRVLRRAAKLGDGWFPLAAPGDELASRIAYLRELRKDEGRQDAPFAICGYANVENGNREKWERQYRRWEEVGATHISLRTTPPVLGKARPGIAARYHINSIDEYARSVALPLS